MLKFHLKHDLLIQKYLITDRSKILSTQSYEAPFSKLFEGQFQTFQCFCYCRTQLRILVLVLAQYRTLLLDSMKLRKLLLRCSARLIGVLAVILLLLLIEVLEIAQGFRGSVSSRS